MRIAIYATEVRDEFIPTYKRIINFLNAYQIDISMSKEIIDVLKVKYGLDVDNVLPFENNQIGSNKLDLVLSVGGDGTFLNAVSMAVGNNVPVAGVNCGRLGFLADITTENIEEALHQYVTGEYTLDYRSMLKLVEPADVFPEFNFAVNELSVHKLQNSSMIKIETSINGEFLANYWADGLIVSTPTGSTAYSLSVGGPIVTPELAGLIITPIASHHLTVRPVVVPDDVEIELKIEGRGESFLISVDHRSVPMKFSSIIKIRKAEFKIPVIKLKGQSFYSTLRNKLMWGADKRN